MQRTFVFPHEISAVVRLLEEVRDDVKDVVAATALPHATASSSARFTCSTSERKLKEPLAKRAEEERVAGGEKAVLALAASVVLDPLPRQRLAHLACRFLSREDERDVAAEDALEDGPDKRVVRAAEDHGVDARLLERPCVLAHGLRRLGREGIGAFDQRHQPGAGDRKELDSRVERVDEGRVPACRNRRLGREQADPAVPRCLHRRVRLGVITPTTGTSRLPGNRKAAEVAALQAATISLTPCSSR